jgi:heparanase 1
MFLRLLPAAALWMVVAGAKTASAASASPALATMPRVGVVDERYQSYNVEMAEVIGGKFWKPYDQMSKGTVKAGGTALQIGQDPAMFEKRSPVDLADEQLRRLAAALGPAYVRVSGTWANSVYFQDSDDSAPATAPKGFQGVLTRQQWAGVVGFAHAVDAKIVTSFAISEGVRDRAGVWTPDQARRFLTYSKSIGGEIAAAELFNEPSFAAMGGAPAGYDAAAYARDFAVFRPFVKNTAPRMLIVGPGSVGEGETLIPGPLLKTADLLAATPRPSFDVFSYHYYGAASMRCTSMAPGVVGTTAAAALTEDWLSRTDEVHAFYAALRDHYESGKPVWVTETADAACGGNPWGATFLDTFRYLDQLGRLAKRGVAVIFHNTLAASEYGLIDQRTLKPRPNYWAAWLWRNLMGSTVLDAGPSRTAMHLYAHCMRNHSGGVTLMAINTSRTQAQSIDLPMPADRYSLTANELEDAHVDLNGQELALGVDGRLPRLLPRRTSAGSIELAPASITFLAIENAENRSCK